MTSWVESHNNAMDFTDEAMRAKRRGHLDDARELFEKALSSERKALQLMEGVVDEPIYSTMYRSAATLALDCERYRLAEQLAYTALAGEPPGYLIAELRHLAEEATFYTHPLSEGIESAEDGLNVSISGALVTRGQALWSDIIPRFDGVHILLNRMWDFVAGREHGGISGARTDGAPITIGTLVPGSIAVNMRIGQPAQERLPNIGWSDAVIMKTLQTVKAVNESKESELDTLIPIEAYRRTFYDLVKDFAPDGDRVSQVGFAGVVDGKEIRVPLRRTKASFGSRTRTTHEPRHKTIFGRLQGADGFRKRGDQITVVDTNGTAHQVELPPGKIDDIVPRYWSVWVEVKCIGKGDTLTFLSISEANDPPAITGEMGC